MFDEPWGPGGLKASRAELGLSMDTDLKSKSIWQIPLHPLLQVIKEQPEQGRPVLLVVVWDTPAKKQQRVGPET